MWSALLTACLVSVGQAQLDARADEFVPVELSAVGLDTRVEAPVVLLRDTESDHVVPIWVGAAEAQAIYLALRGISTPRPMTHDLLASVVKELRAEVKEVLIHDLRDGVYYGQVRFQIEGSGDIRDVDSRPSDALALALRVGAPILVARKILEAAAPFEFVTPDELDPVVRTLGITVVGLTDERRRSQDLPDHDGVLVTAVVGDARDRGLRAGDVIQAVNDEAASDPMTFFHAVRRAVGTGTVRLTVWRDGTAFEVTLFVSPAGQGVIV